MNLCAIFAPRLAPGLRQDLRRIHATGHDGSVVSAVGEVMGTLP
jgi:hypothetical protein